MAVPSGSYDLTASLDLSPVFGIIASSQPVEVTVPGPEVLDEHLKKLESEDANVRMRTIYDLRYFREDAERVVPVLLARLQDRDETVRGAALSVFISYPTGAEKNVSVFLPFLADGTDREKLTAFQLVARNAPAGEEFLAALEKALAEAPENYKYTYKSNLDRYRARTAPK